MNTQKIYLLRPYLNSVLQASTSRLSTSCVLQNQKRTSVIRAMKTDRGDFQGMGYILLVIPVAGLCLGTWQVQRRKWKLALIAQMENKTMENPIPLPTNIEDCDDLEYCRVKVKGQFDHSKELLIHPRSLISKESSHGGGLISGQSQSGSHVITAFELADRDLRIMVNRGWVPRNKVNPATRQKGQIEGEVELVGVFRKSEKRPQFGAKNEPEKGQWHNRDQDAMGQVLNTAPLLIDADFKSTVPDGPVGGQTRLSLRNEHFSYIVTWYSLSAITFLMWYMRYWKPR